MRRINSTVSSLLLEWMVFFPPPLLSTSPLSEALVARNTGCPLSAKLSTMTPAVLFHSPFGLLTWVPYHIFSQPSPGNDHHPCGNFLAYAATFTEFAIQYSWCPCVHNMMSLYIDMKMILHLNCSGSDLNSAIIFWISSRIPNIVNPGIFVHSSSIGSPSIWSKSFR